jgi:hypothetical protein
VLNLTWFLNATKNKCRTQNTTNMDNEDITKPFCEQHTLPNVTEYMKNFCIKKSKHGANGVDITNEMWLYLIKTGAGPYAVRQLYNNQVEEAEAKKGWTFERLGRTETVLNDGTRIFIGGEYDDYYDPDFHIYNDVVVVKPDGQVTIYGYAETVFPPTDFHAAVLVNNKIFIIGNVGYHDKRLDTTQVAELDLETFKIKLVNTTGNSPGWISNVEADYDAKHNTITVIKAKHLENNQMVNIKGTYRLNLNDNIWKKL